MNIEGVWKFDSDEEVRAYDDDGALLDNIALVYRDEFGHLIAAAPELYDACEATLAAIYDATSDDPQFKFGDLWNTVSAALAKARGEQVTA